MGIQTSEEKLQSSSANSMIPFAKLRMHTFIHLQILNPKYIDLIVPEFGAFIQTE